MIRLGERQTLTVARIKDFGIYLTDPAEKTDDMLNNSVLLPKKEVPECVSIGDEVDVFIYRDSSDRLIATRREPLITMGEVKALTVKEVTGIGAFLDWGLEKDLMVPFREQTVRLKAGDKPLVALYIDKSSRLCATMRIYDYLRTDSLYRENDYFQGTVFGINEKIGVFVAVDDKYIGMVPIAKAPQGVRIGDTVRGRVLHIRHDGKLELTTQEKINVQMDIDSAKLKRIMEEHFGRLPVTEKDDPELIREKTGMSKAAFKRAVGRLLKEREISIEDGIIKLNDR